MTNTKVTVKVNLNLEITQEDFDQLVVARNFIDKVPYPEEVIPETDMPDLETFRGTLEIFYRKLKKYFDE